MELPKFKYSPNAYELDIFESTEGVCTVCNEKRQIKYIGSFYSVEEPEYICPWCIANGKAAEKYEGDDYCGIEGVSSDPNDPEPTIPKELLLEITNKTPSYSSWQQEVWLTHCNEPCAFIGYADTKTIEPLIEELKEDIEYSSYDADNIKSMLSKDGSLVGYLFQCVKCNQPRLHVDCDYNTTTNSTCKKYAELQTSPAQFPTIRGVRFRAGCYKPKPNRLPKPVRFY